jgi:hypothetical protein
LNSEFFQMPRGGARPGAGRKSGEQWATKKPVAVRTLARRKLVEILQREDDPLSVAIAIAGDDSQDVSVRLQAVQTVLPYIYPRLSAQITADATEQLKHADPKEIRKRRGDDTWRRVAWL